MECTVPRSAIKGRVSISVEQVAAAVRRWVVPKSRLAGGARGFQEATYSTTDGSKVPQPSRGSSSGEQKQTPEEAKVKERETCGNRSGRGEVEKS